MIYLNIIFTCLQQAGLVIRRVADHGRFMHNDSSKFPKAGLYLTDDNQTSNLYAKKIS
jgi:hypothetical protein